MNNLVIRETQSPFIFLAKPSKRPANNGCCGLAWIYDNFHLGGHNYYLYTCSRGERLIKKGIPAKECLFWGGKYV